MTPCRCRRRGRRHQFRQRADAPTTETSNEKVNQLWSNLVWSNVDNFLTIPTDCPQRNERMGWSGDINVFSRTATYVSNADQFLTRHMFAMRDVQLPSGRFTDVAPVGGGFGGVLWGSAGIVVPWEIVPAVQGRGDRSNGTTRPWQPTRTTSRRPSTRRPA